MEDDTQVVQDDGAGDDVFTAPTVVSGTYVPNVTSNVVLTANVVDTSSVTIPA